MHISESKNVANKYLHTRIVSVFQSPLPAFIIQHHHPNTHPPDRCKTPPSSPPPGRRLPWLPRPEAGSRRGVSRGREVSESRAALPGESGPPADNTNKRAARSPGGRQPRRRRRRAISHRTQSAGGPAREMATIRPALGLTVVTTQLQSPELYHEWRKNGLEVPARLGAVFHGNYVRWCLHTASEVMWLNNVCIV